MLHRIIVASTIALERDVQITYDNNVALYEGVRLQQMVALFFRTLFVLPFLMQLQSLHL